MLGSAAPRSEGARRKVFRRTLAGTISTLAIVVALCEPQATDAYVLEEWRWHKAQLLFTADPALLPFATEAGDHWGAFADISIEPGGNDIAFVVEEPSVVGSVGANDSRAALPRSTL